MKKTSICKFFELQTCFLGQFYVEQLKQPTGNTNHYIALIVSNVALAQYSELQTMTSQLKYTPSFSFIVLENVKKNRVILE